MKDRGVDRYGGETEEEKSGRQRRAFLNETRRENAAAAGSGGDGSGYVKEETDESRRTAPQLVTATDIAGGYDPEAEKRSQEQRRAFLNETRRENAAAAGSGALSDEERASLRGELEAIDNALTQGGEYDPWDYLRYSDPEAYEKRRASLRKRADEISGRLAEDGKTRVTEEAGLFSIGTAEEAEEALRSGAIKPLGGDDPFADVEDTLRTGDMEPETRFGGRETSEYADGGTKTMPENWGLGEQMWDIAQAEFTSAEHVE